VFGIFGHPDAAAITALGLHALQHRGQEAAGIVSFDGKRFHSERRWASSATLLPPRRDRPPARHHRHRPRALFDTTGETILRNVQPLFAELEGGGFAIAHNGNLTNGADAAPPLVARRRDLPVDLRHRGDPASGRAQPRNRFVDRFIEALRQIEGAYSLVALTNKKLIGARDPLGIRPLVLGELDGCRSSPPRPARSTSSARKFVRDVENGEVIVFDEERRAEHKPFPPRRARPCIFEYIYFARPDSIVGGRRSTTCASAWARNSPRSAGRRRRRRAGAGFRRAGRDRLCAGLGIPFELGIIRNHYVGRTFIEPTQRSASSACGSSTAPTAPWSRASASC
jgi:amidophosphoribosyltransferase